MTHSSVNCRRSKEPNTGLKAQRLCPEVSCSSGRNGGLGSSVTSAKIGRYENRFSSQSHSMPRSHRPSTGTHQKPVTVDNIKKRSVDMSYNQPGSQTSIKSGCRKMFNRRPNNSEEVDIGTSEVLHHVTDTNEEANLPREPGADDSGDESVNSSSGIGTKVPNEPSADDSGDGSNTSSSSDSVHTRDDDKDDCHNSVPKHVAERVSSPVKHSVPIKQKSTRVTGVQQDADTEPCVSAEPEYQYTEDAACSGTVCTVPNSPTTQTQEPDSDETQTKEEVSAETQTPESAETQTEEPDSDETQTKEVVSAETVSAETQNPDSDET
ncbi:otolith matrix protein OMM-64-like isoform X2 [Oncorhynchus nerka]|uniref:otolith matrix protein OMM-64-like isoform X2 n=1 Tax=Oncorhynchus nerka TaxID=8023 RepID=UPI0011307E20|nr:otolith matrix protein OMM-64-like isoform X2 [Oncorhynchus nerka]